MTARDPITIERLKEVLSYDAETGLFTWRVRTAHRIQIGDPAGCRASNNYILIRIDGALFGAHRLAWFYVTGIWPANEIDHINRQPSDNRFCNLREATHAQNLRNRGIDSSNKSGCQGVHLRKDTGKWAAYVEADGKRTYLGCFTDFADAVAAREQAAAIYFGEFSGTHRHSSTSAPS